MKKFEESNQNSWLIPAMRKFRKRYQTKKSKMIATPEYFKVGNDLIKTLLLPQNLQHKTVKWH